MPSQHDGDVERLRSLISRAYEDRELSSEPEARQAVEAVIAGLDEGRFRAASRQDDGRWQPHAWISQAILLYFGIRKMVPEQVGSFEFFDKIPLKRNIASQQVRVVPPATIRYGAFLEPGVVLMPSYINIGAYVGSRTMVDTWATVGSCAQIGRECHLSGGAGIGGVLEPPGACPVIIEDGCFIGSRVIIVEGVQIAREAVIGAGVVLTSSTVIIDVTGSEPVEHRGRVPERSVVIPGARSKRFPAGEFGVPCALIIGQRQESTDRKISLNAALRDYGVQV